MTNKCIKELVDLLMYSRFTLEYINKSTVEVTKFAYFILQWAYLDSTHKDEILNSVKFNTMFQ
jgi:hypothetical protein